MPINFHKDLQNSQLHNPKDFVDAKDRSILIKNDSSLLKWVPADYTLTVTIVCRADVSKNLSGRSFYICSDNDANKYQVWFDVDSDPGTLVLQPGYTGVEVDISENDTASTVATALKVALAGVGFTASSSTGTVTVSGIKTAENASDYSTEFNITNVQSNTNNQYMTTDSSGLIKWQSQPAIKSLHQFSAVVAPKSSSAINIYHADGTQGHDNKTLSVSVGSTMPTTVSSAQVPMHSVMFIPDNVMSWKIHYTVYHSDMGTQNVNFKFAETKLITGLDATQNLVTVATISDSVPTGQTVTKDVSCTSSISANKGLVLYGAGPTTRQYYIYGVIELTIT